VKALLKQGELYTDKLFEKARKWQKLQTTGYLSSSPPSSPLFRLLLSLFLYSPPPLPLLLSSPSPPYPIFLLLILHPLLLILIQSCSPDLTSSRQGATHWWQAAG
jgi:hypothetical protein